MVSVIDKPSVLSSNPQLSIETIPLGIDLEQFRASKEVLPSTSNTPSLVITGSMQSKRNVDGVLYFLHDIYPRIVCEAPEVEVWIVGNNPSHQILECASSLPNVHVTGLVPDLRPYIERAWIYVCSIRYGTGLKTRVLEAMAMSKAIVGTSISFDGLDVTSGREAIMADEPEEFARQVISLLNDPTMRTQLGEAARRYVEENHDWKDVGQQVERLYETAIERHTHRSNHCVGGRSDTVPDIN